MKIRIHGDYHLGQVLFTGKIFDHRLRRRAGAFHRRTPAQTLSAGGPWRACCGHSTTRFRARCCNAFRRCPEDAPLLQSWADAWYHYVAGSFLRAYVQTTASARLVPAKPAAFEALLQPFLIEKAVYEVGYEMNNRPDWLAIPMRGIFQVLGSEATV